MNNNVDWKDIPEKELKNYQDRLALVETLTDDQIDDLQRLDVRLQYRLEHNVGERTIRNYLRRYKNEGVMGLLFVRKKQHLPRIADDSLSEAILKSIEERPTRTVPQLRRLLSSDPELQNSIEQVSDRTIYRFLLENGLTQKNRHALLKENGRKSYHQFQAVSPMALVQGDARDGIYLPDPNSKEGKQRKTYLFLWLDDFSRKILYAEYYWDEKLPRMEDTFKKMILRWGIPEKIYLDNGSVYIASQFAWVLKELNIKKIHHPPYSAWCKGKVEAIMKTIKNDFQADAQIAGFKTLEELNTAFWAWSYIEYNRRIHSSTGQAPEERFAKNVNKDHRRIKDLEWFENLFMIKETRTVSKYGNVKLCGNKYHCTTAVHGTVVEVRYDPFDLNKVYRFENGKSLETLGIRTLVNERAPKLAEEIQQKPQQVSEKASRYFTDLRERLIVARKTAQLPEYTKLKGGS